VFDVEEARVNGHLYGLAFGFPALVAPEDSIRAVDTTGYTFDAAAQRRLDAAGEPSVLGETLAYRTPADTLAEAVALTS
jgi:gamma-glutamylcyclotransferase (GGCT)/AIG2-like uncharacterized protein YtfP